MDSPLALSRAESANAKRWSRWALIAHGVTLLVAFGALVLDAPWACWLALATLVGEGAAWWARWQSTTTHSRAEACRRRALLMAALDADPGDLDTVDVMQRINGWSRTRAVNYENGHYWSSTSPVGPERLREALQESAFWSSHLYRHAGATALWAFGALSLLIAIAGLSLLLAGSGDIGVTAARAMVVVLTAVVATDAFGDALRWFSTARAAENVDRVLVGADLSDPATLAVVMADYATVTEGARPIPEWIYERSHDRLLQAWAERTGAAART